MLRPIHLSILVPVVLGLTYMILHEDLSATGMILTVCIAFTTLMMFIVYKISEADLKIGDNSSGDKVDRSLFKVRSGLMLKI